MSNLSPISILGKSFVYGSKNTRFMVRGVALSATSTLSINLGIKDILANQHNSLMKNTIIPQLQALNVNCVRVYQVDENNQHNLTMNDLDAAGIYVMVGLATPTYSIKQMTGQYDDATFVRASKIVDEFQQYDNTFCFSVGNEVEFPGQQAANLHSKYPSKTATQIVTETVDLELKVAQAMKSFARDIKNHISTSGYRTIPVGAAMQDGPQTSWENNNPNAYQRGLIGTDTIAEYYTAGGASEIMDFIGINTYRYVTQSTLPHTNLNAYDGLAKEASNLAVPVFLTESGGLGLVPRDWAIVPQMYTEKLLYEQLSGEMAFQMLEEGAGYGLYTIDSGNNLTATSNGGATDLGNEFSSVSGMALNKTSTAPVVPTTAPPTAGSNSTITITWLPLLPLKAITAPNIKIDVENFADVEIQIVQQGIVRGTVPGITGSKKSICKKIKVASGVAISIQGYVKPNWDAVCGVPANKVTKGITVSNAVAWGPSVSCLIS